MKSLAITLICLTVLGAFSSVVSAEEKVFIIDAVFYRVRGEIAELKVHEVRAKRSLPGRIGSRLFRKRSHSKKEVFILFERAELSVAGVELKADEQSWTWDAKGQHPHDGSIELISHPRVAAAPGEPFLVKTISHAAIDYLEKRPDGLFELKRSNVPLGIRFEGRLDEGKSDRLVELSLTIMANFVVKRRPIEGVKLDVGAPIIEEYETSAIVKAGRYYGLLLSTEGQGGLIIRLRVDPQDES